MPVRAEGLSFRPGQACLCSFDRFYLLYTIVFGGRSDIQPGPGFLFCLLAEFFHLDRVGFGKLIQAFNTECPEELFRRPEKQRPAGRLLSAYFFYEIIGYQLVDRVVTVDTADMLHVHPGRGLFIGDDGQGLQKGIGQDLFLGHLGNFDQVFVLVCSC